MMSAKREFRSFRPYIARSIAGVFTSSGEMTKSVLVDCFSRFRRGLPARIKLNQGMA